MKGGGVIVLGELEGLGVLVKRVGEGGKRDIDCGSRVGGGEFKEFVGGR